MRPIVDSVSKNIVDNAIQLSNRVLNGILWFIQYSIVKWVSLLTTIIWCISAFTRHDNNSDHNIL